MSGILARLVPGMFVCGLLAACGARPVAEPPQPTIILEPCQLSIAGMEQAEEARCATLTVFEDRVAGSGRTIDLHIAVLPAIGRNPAPDPLVLLAGGPGQAATEAFAPLIASLGEINQQRDLLLVDQRGTGSSNPLHCPDAQDSLTEELSDDAALAWSRECLASLEADPRHYTTAVAAADLDQVRAALGYQQLNLLGVSYGTRAALTYLKLFPERVRTVILDSVVPQEAALGIDFAAYGQQALERIFARCAADEACNRAFPALPATFSRLLEQLERKPALVRLNDPATGAPVEVRLTRDLVATTVQSLSYAPETAALLPLLIHQTAVENNPAPLAAQLLIVGAQIGESMALGMRLAVVCSEDVPFYPDNLSAPGANSYLGNYVPRQFKLLCTNWPRGTLPDDFKAPVVSSVPTLLLSGEDDPVTPPASAETAARTLSNSLHIVAPGQGHNVFYRGCLPTLIADFVEQAATNGLATECVQKLRPTPFFTSFTGPTA